MQLKLNHFLTFYIRVGDQPKFRALSLATIIFNHRKPGQSNDR